METIQSITPTNFILALIERDDGVRMLLGSDPFSFSEDQAHFSRNDFVNDIVEIQGGDGTLLAGQVRRASAQEFEGFVGDGSSTKQEVEDYRRQFFKFFRKNYYYRVIYIFSDGTAIQRRRGYIVDAPEIKELYQFIPEWRIALNFEDVNYYQYAEAPDGSEIFGNSAVLTSSAVQGGGLVWDEYGVEWDAIGAIWEEGSSGASNIVTTDSVDNVYPTWTVTGPAQNPVLENITLGKTIRYAGNVTATQTLVVDMERKTALLNGTSVVGNLSGNWISLGPGNNRMSYTTDNADAPNCTIGWQEVVG